MAGKIRNKLELFPDIHARFKRVQVENQDWEDCIKDYDSTDAVIYCDPPYCDVYRGTYKNEMSPKRHLRKTVFPDPLDPMIILVSLF